MRVGEACLIWLRGKRLGSLEIKLSAPLAPNSIFITSAVHSAAMVTLLKYYFAFNNVPGNKRMSVINKMEVTA